MGYTWLRSTSSLEKSSKIFARQPTTWKFQMLSAGIISSLEWTMNFFPLWMIAVTRDDLKCPESGEVGDAIRTAIEQEQDILCTILSACGEECVIATKINTAVDK